jgi:hypothetical protein
MQNDVQIRAQLCQSNHNKTGARGFFSKAYPPCYCTFVASYYFFFILELLVLKINPPNAVPDPAPTLLDSNFVEPTNLQLLFRSYGKYAASTHFIHIQVPFNFSQLLATPDNIFFQYIFLQGIHPLLPHLHRQLLLLLHHGTFGPQNKSDRCSAGSGADTARLQLSRTC